MAKIRTYMHKQSSGDDKPRWCQLVGGHWRIIRDDIVTTELCPMDHYMSMEIEADDDRGDFGMPGIGRMFPPITKHPVPPDREGYYTMKVDATGIALDYGDEGQDIDFATDEARRIARTIPTWLARFLQKNRKYARAQKIDLGARGIMPDINRKTSVLVDRIWYGAEEVDEGTVEVIDDLIGHLLLLRDKVEHDASQA